MHQNKCLNSIGKIWFSAHVKSWMSKIYQIESGERFIGFNFNYRTKPNKEILLRYFHTTDLKILSIYWITSKKQANRL